MIIALEGPPAAGKSTVSEALVRGYDATRIEEVNLRFRRPLPEPPRWYLERQLDRLATAVERDGTDRIVVLDGDPYQPIWLSWMDPDRFEPWREVLHFFRQRGRAAFVPHCYVYLAVAEEERRRRELTREAVRGHDPERAQRKYLRYRSFQAPQRAFFEALGTAFPGFVLLLQPEVPSVLAERAASHRAPCVTLASLLAAMEDWLGAHTPASFS